MLATLYAPDADGFPSLSNLSVKVVSLVTLAYVVSILLVFTSFVAFEPKKILSASSWPLSVSAGYRNVNVLGGKVANVPDTTVVFDVTVVV